LQHVQRGSKFEYEGQATQVYPFQMGKLLGQASQVPVEGLR